MKVKQNVILIIVDGFGIAPPHEGNAVGLAKTPNWDTLVKTYPHIELQASGNHVGLPDGVMGNSEVGHLTIGTGRITYQSLERINQTIKRDELSNKQEIQDLISHIKNHSGRIHLMGLLSDGQVHSDQDHLHALIDIFQPHSKHVFIHGFTDGRDTPIDSSPTYINRLKNHNEKYDNVTLATIIGRYYAMDRDKKWERTKIAYDCLVKREGEKTDDIIATIEDRYQEDETDEFLKPIVIDESASIRNGDAVLFFNFRPDRARQITQAFNYEVPFETKKFNDLLYTTMTRYDETWDLPVVFNSKTIRNSIAETLSKAEIPQIHIAETEKYAHVTYFLNGGIEEPFDGEDRVLVPSPKIATYDLQPEMSTPGIIREAKKAIGSGKYPFVVINIACPDMVGHTGDVQATVTAVEAMDTAFGEIYDAAVSNNYILAITADHGNAEKMLEGESVHTAHTTNPVPFLITDKTLQLSQEGGLKHVAATLLTLMGIPIPEGMDGGSILR